MARFNVLIDSKNLSYELINDNSETYYETLGK